MTSKHVHFVQNYIPTKFHISQSQMPCEHADDGLYLIIMQPGRALL